MSVDRPMRETIPPLLGLSSLVVGVLTSPGAETVITKVHESFQNGGLGAIVSALAAGGVALIAVGYIFGLVAIGSFRIVASILYVIRLRKSPQYPVQVDGKTLARFASVLGVAQPNEKFLEDRQLYILAAVCHGGAISSDMTAWFLRRWNSAMVSANCALMLLVVGSLGYFALDNPRLNLVIVKLLGLSFDGSPGIEFKTNTTWWIVNAVLLFLTILHTVSIRFEIGTMYRTLAGTLPVRQQGTLTEKEPLSIVGKDRSS